MSPILVMQSKKGREGERHGRDGPLQEEALFEVRSLDEVGAKGGDCRLDDARGERQSLLRRLLKGSVNAPGTSPSSSSKKGWSQFCSRASGLNPLGFPSSRE